MMKRQYAENSEDGSMSLKHKVYLPKGLLMKLKSAAARHSG